MLELVFDQSLAGAMRKAKGHRRGTVVSRGVKIYMKTVGTREEGTKGWSEPCEIRTAWNGAMLEGAAADVAMLLLSLSVGDIAGMVGMDLSARKAALARLEDPWAERYEAAGERYWGQNLDTLARLGQAVEEGEPVRIWATSWCPHEVCGLYYMCHLLRDTNSPVFWGCPPREILRKDGVREQVHGLGQFPPEMLGDLAADAVRLPPELRRQYGACWLELVKENAPLRAVVNGTLMNVPEEFYDFALRKNLPVEEPKRMGCVLAETLRQTPGGGDTWLYLRLMKLVGKGEVEIVESARPDHPYSAMIRCKTGCQRSREGLSGK